jgi:hypothetical protein
LRHGDHHDGRPDIPKSWQQVRLLTVICSTTATMKNVLVLVLLLGGCASNRGPV